MSDHRCTFVLEWQLHDEDGDRYSTPFETCDKIAHFKDDMGWWCAEHWDERQREGKWEDLAYSTIYYNGDECDVDCVDE